MKTKGTIPTGMFSTTEFTPPQNDPARLTYSGADAGKVTNLATDKMYEPLAKNPPLPNRRPAIVTRKRAI